jgi:hypothetical protein
MMNFLILVQMIKLEHILRYLIKEINWNNRKKFINVLDKISIIYNSDNNIKIEESNNKIMICYY